MKQTATWTFRTVMAAWFRSCKTRENQLLSWNRPPRGRSELSWRPDSGPANTRENQLLSWNRLPRDCLELSWRPDSGPAHTRENQLLSWNRLPRDRLELSWRPDSGPATKRTSQQHQKKDRSRLYQLELSWRPDKECLISWLCQKRNRPTPGRNLNSFKPCTYKS